MVQKKERVLPPLALGEESGDIIMGVKRKGGDGGQSSSGEDDEDYEERRALSSTRRRAALNDEAALARCRPMLDPSLPFVETLIVDYALEVNTEDDLEREVALYNATLKAVQEGRRLLKESGEKVDRPADFFCEMLKSDEHMARVKDELLFQQKKMEAFEKRKERQHQVKFSKSVKAEKVAEKAARKKEAAKEVSEFRKEASARGRKFGRRKQEAKDKKWGFGGRNKAMKKKNDAKSINDTSDFNPKRGKEKRRK